MMEKYTNTLQIFSSYLVGLGSAKCFCAYFLLTRLVVADITRVSHPEWFWKSGNQWTSLEQLKTRCM